MIDHTQRKKQASSDQKSRTGKMSEEERDGSCTDCENNPAYVYCCGDSGNRFSPMRVFLLIGSFFFYLTDVGLDIWVAYEHYFSAQNGDEASNYYFQTTLFFIIFPVITINFLSWSLYAWGWIMFRSKTIKNYCKDHAIPIHTFYVINWPWYHRSKSVKKQQSINGNNLIELENFSSDCEEAPRNSDPAPSSSIDGISGSPSHSFPQLRFAQSHSDRDLQTVPILEDTDTGLEFYPLDFFFTREFVAVTIIHIFQLGYMFRVIRLIFKRKQDEYSFDRYRDLSFLRLMEAFLESAPQFVLQLYIATVKTETRLVYNIVTPLALIFSVCSLALAVADYVSAAKDLNYYDPPPNHRRNPRLTWTGYFIIIFWHLFMISGRGIAFALFASIYGSLLFMVIGIHYFAMLYWMYWQNAYVFINSSDDYFLSYKNRTRRGSGARPKNQPIDQRSPKSCLDPRNSLCRNYGLEFIAAAFNLFFHFKFKEGSSIETLVPFYVITFVENTLMILLWYFSRDFGVHIWYSEVALIAVFCTFITGVVLMVVYYVWFQPKDKEEIEQNTDLDHPTMTCSFNRLYTDKIRKEDIFTRMHKIFFQKSQ